MTELNLSQKVLEKIKEKHIKPKPRWQFTAKNIAVWLLGLLALIFGGFATSVVIYMLVNNDWDVYEHISGSLPEFVFITMPYYWLVFMIIFIGAANYYLKHTKKGYRYKLRTIVLALFLSSTFLGILFYNVGMGKAIDEVFTKSVPFYSDMMGHRKGLWNMPDKGRIAGEIISVVDGNTFKLKGVDGLEWSIVMKDVITSSEQIIIVGNRVKVMGDKLDERTFEAYIVRPMGIPFGGILDNRRNVKQQLMKDPDLRRRMIDPEFRGSMKCPGMHVSEPEECFKKNCGTCS